MNGISCQVLVQFAAGDTLRCPGDATVHVLTATGDTFAVCRICAQSFIRRGGHVDGTHVPMQALHELRPVCTVPTAVWGDDCCRCRRASDTAAELTLTVPTHPAVVTR